MPRAAKASSRKGTSRADPLSTKGANANKKAPQDSSVANETETSSTSNTNKNDVSCKPASEANYLLMVAMTLSSDPMISRTLSVSPNLTFEKLHRALQIAFGWANSHMHTFTVEISSSIPRSWPKRVLYLQNTTYDDDDFDIGIVPKPQSEAAWTLRDVYERQEWTHKAHDAEPGAEPEKLNMEDAEKGLRLGITYEYDMGDGWEHQIILMGRADPGLHRTLGVEGDVAVVCLSGEGHPCAEDCGSAPGWEDLKAAFKKQKGDKGRKDWYKHVCLNGDPKGLDPYKWSILEVNDELQKIKP
ncbi:MAG: hypothetical protein HETSPECPRED_006672 [Heterodermia speciosa]|uniref:Plasmid pRiA4b Orf3-like domain-containing protein n=1 Tax=Heterodermia speciosa TaxID=116794 RepID=A0A8H3FNA8_9LECA|nr:MAG: hypothetical protein HETSPECPRED_006672 [Heterodermia speciosa]